MPIHDWTRVDAGIFHDFHHEWISTIKRALNAGVLPPDYYALAEQIAGGLGPDVLTLESVRADPGRTAGGGATTGDAGGEGGIALATGPPQVRFTATAETEAYAHKRSRIAIRHASGDRVVAMLEIVWLQPLDRVKLRGLGSWRDGHDRGKAFAVPSRCGRRGRWPSLR